MVVLVDVVVEVVEVVEVVLVDVDVDVVAVGVVVVGTAVAAVVVAVDGIGTTATPVVPGALAPVVVLPHATAIRASAASHERECIMNRGSVPSPTGHRDTSP
jgi:Mg2+/citrate symporter